MTKYALSFIALLGITLNSYAQDVITPSSGKDIQAKIIEINKTDILYKKFDNLNGPTLTIPKTDVIIISYANGTKEVMLKQIKVGGISEQTESAKDTMKIDSEKGAPAVITFRSGGDVLAYVIELNKASIVYKVANSEVDTSVTVQKSDILLISYEDGTKKVFYKQNVDSPKVKAKEDKNVVSTTELKSEPRVQYSVNLSKRELINKGTEDSKTNYTGKKSGAVWTGVTSFVLTPVVGLIPAIAFSVTTPKEHNLNYNDNELKKDPDYDKAYVRQARRTKTKNVLIGYSVGSAVWIAAVFL